MNSTLLAQLRNALANLYSDESSVRRIMSDSNMDLIRINFNNTPQNLWHAILVEANRTNRTEALLNAVAEEYGTDSKFCNNYCKSLKQPIAGKKYDSQLNSVSSILSSDERQSLTYYLKENRQWATASPIGRRGILVDAGLPVEWVNALQIDGTSTDNYRVLTELEQYSLESGTSKQTYLVLLVAWLSRFASDNESLQFMNQLLQKYQLPPSISNDTKFQREAQHKFGNIILGVSTILNVHSSFGPPDQESFDNDENFFLIYLSLGITFVVNKDDYINSKIVESVILTHPWCSIPFGLKFGMSRADAEQCLGLDFTPIALRNRPNSWLYNSKFSTSYLLKFSADGLQSIRVIGKTLTYE